jgi:peptide subunit release factor 1 (eRF1)
VRRASDLQMVIVAPRDARRDRVEAVDRGTRGDRRLGAGRGAREREELLEVAKPHIERARSNADRVGARTMARGGRPNGRAVAGWDATLEAASDGRVELLLVREGANREAFQCPECGRGSATGGSCPLDGTRLERRPDGSDLAVHHVLAHGGSVIAVRRDDLGEHDGIGALLRF